MNICDNYRHCHPGTKIIAIEIGIEKAPGQEENLGDVFF